MKKKNILIFSLIILIIFLIFSLYFIYFSNNDDIIDESNNIPEIDKRISPQTNQGIIFEIYRIRNRGLLEQIMNPGNNYMNKPMFYYICEIDGAIYDSRYMTSANLKNYEPFETWDTIFMDHRLQRDVEEENETCNIKLTLIEEVNVGLFGLRSFQKIEKLRFTYNFITGRWIGDDFLFDNDGYGHYLGKYFEIWFNIYQTDYDHDGIPYRVEVDELNTDPCVNDISLDPDDDLIPTFWEWRWGYNPNSWDDHLNLDPDIDGLNNYEEYIMMERFSNPFKQDIYIEADGMKQNSILDKAHILWEESSQIVIERFAEHGISVYFDFGWPDNPLNGGGELLTHYRAASYDLGTLYQYYKYHFPEERIGIFRYFVVAHSSGFAIPSKFNYYDCFSVDTSKEIMWKFTRRAYTERRQLLAQASGIMHELGHTLGISHSTIEGCDNFSFYDKPIIQNYFNYKETWGQYVSSMNYFYIWDYDVVDYSDGGNNEQYDQNDWLELYLPTFQIEAADIEDPTTANSDKYIEIIEDFECIPEGWEYNLNITKDFLKYIKNWSPIDPILCNWRVYNKENSNNLTDLNIRVYAQPILYTTLVTPSEWSLIFEGFYNKNENFDLGNHNNIFINIL